MVSSLCIVWIYPLITGLLSFYFFKLQASTISDLAHWILLLCLTAIAGCFVGLCIGAMCEDRKMALIILQAAMIILNFGAGALANTGEGANWFIMFLTYISPVKYLTELLMKQILKGEPTQIVDYALTYYGYTISSEVCYIVAIGLILTTFCLGWIVLTCKLRDI